MLQSTLCFFLIISYPVNKFISSLIYLVTSWGLPDPKVGTARVWETGCWIVQMLGWADLWGQRCVCVCVCVCVWVSAGRRRFVLSDTACVHIYMAQFDISASYCVQRSAAAGGIFSCFIHELINGAQIALLSILTNAQPACVCLLRHSSLLAEGHRKQHKLSILLYAPQKIWHNIRTYAMKKILFYPPAISHFIPS